MSKRIIGYRNPAPCAAPSTVPGATDFSNWTPVYEGEGFTATSPTVDDELVARQIKELDYYRRQGVALTDCAMQVICSDMEALLARLERYREALERLSSSFTGGWAGMYRERAEVIGEVEQIARKALSDSTEGEV